MGVVWSAPYYTYNGFIYQATQPIWILVTTLKIFGVNLTHNCRQVIVFNFIMVTSIQFALIYSFYSNFFGCLLFKKIP